MMCILSQLKLFTKNAPFWCQRFVVVIHTLFVSIGSFHQLLRWQHWRYWIIGWQRHRTATTSDDREQIIRWTILTFLLLYKELFALGVRMTFWGQWWGRWGTARSVWWTGVCPSLAFWSQFTPSADPWSAVWQGTECRGPVNNWWGGEMRLERTLTIAHHWIAGESVFITSA